MQIIIVNTECPYCGCKDLKPIGTQEGISYDLELANCTNEECEPHTIVLKKIPKEVK